MCSCCYTPPAPHTQSYNVLAIWANVPAAVIFSWRWRLSDVYTDSEGGCCAWRVDKLNHKPHPIPCVHARFEYKELVRLVLWTQGSVRPPFSCSLPPPAFSPFTRPPPPSPCHCWWWLFFITTEDTHSFTRTFFSSRWVIPGYILCALRLCQVRSCLVRFLVG